MNELTLDGKIYVSSKRAAEITGYAKDYVGQLCREGRVEARLVGRNWYILRSAIEKHRFAANPASTEDAVVQDTATSWERPLYKRDEAAELPAIDKFESLQGPYLESEAEQVEENTPQSTVEAMQEAWKSWFNRTETHQETQMEEVDNDEIVPEALEESASEETLIPIRPIDDVVEEREALNLRRIREYREEEQSEYAEEVAVEQIPAVRGGTYNYSPIYRAVFILIAVIALSIGYIGAGFASKSLISYGPASFLAGVSTYNTSIK